MKGNRCIEELNEIGPVLAWCMHLLTPASSTGVGGAGAGAVGAGAKVEIIDLCSGFGYMGMFLSELLPPERVDRITLVDNMCQSEFLFGWVCGCGTGGGACNRILCFVSSIIGALLYSVLLHASPWCAPLWCTPPSSHSGASIVRSSC